MSRILICGASLAGLACAIRLKQLGHEALVIDKNAFPRAKLCGEFLGPDAMPFLEKLGLLETIRAHAYGPVERAYFHGLRESRRPLEIRMAWMSREHPYGLAIPREQLDYLLLSHARALGIAVLERHRALAPVRQDEAGRTRFRIGVEIREADRSVRHETFETDILVDAAGRNSRLAPGSGNHRTKKVGVQCHVKRTGARFEPALRMFLFPGGYGGIQPFSPDQANLCMLLDARLAEFIRKPFHDFVGKTIGHNSSARRFLAGCERAGEPHTTVVSNLDPDRGADWIRVGDARVTVDPFTGSGMAHALESGWLAADCITEGFCRNLDYARILDLYRHRYGARFGKRLRLLRYFRPAMDSAPVQDLLWPMMPVVAPVLARAFR